MMGFLVSTAAVFFTAWIVYVATYRAAYMQGQMDMLRDAARNQGIVPAGTPNPLQGVQCKCMVPDPCYNGDTCCSGGNYDPTVAQDDRIYGRNG